MQRLNQVQGSLVGLFQDLERVRSQAVRAAQVLSIWIRTALLGVRVCRSEGCLSGNKAHMSVKTLLLAEIRRVVGGTPRRQAQDKLLPAVRRGYHLLFQERSSGSLFAV
jgi:hypothetical protein